MQTWGVPQPAPNQAANQAAAWAEVEQSRMYELRDRVQLWNDASSRKWWLLTGKPPSHSFGSRELQGGSGAMVFVSTNVAQIFRTLSAFDVSVIMPRGAYGSSASARISLPDRLGLRVTPSAA